MNTINKIVIYGKDRKEFYLNESVSNKIEFQNNLIEHLLKVSSTNQSIALMYQERNAELERKEYAVPKHNIYVSVNYPDGCDIIGDGSHPEDSTNIKICINPKSGYKFKRWTKGTNTTSNVAYVPNIKSDLYFEAELEKLEPVKDINISVICDTSMGNYSQNKNSDGSITLTAFANFGYNFKGWYSSNGNYISSSNNITLTEPLTVLPKFEIQTRAQSNVTPGQDPSNPTLPEIPGQDPSSSLQINTPKVGKLPYDLNLLTAPGLYFFRGTESPESTMGILYYAKVSKEMYALYNGNAEEIVKHVNLVEWIFQTEGFWGEDYNNTDYILTKAYTNYQFTDTVDAKGNPVKYKDLTIEPVYYWLDPKHAFLRWEYKPNVLIAKLGVGIQSVYVKKPDVKWKVKLLYDKATVTVETPNFQGPVEKISNNEYYIPDGAKLRLTIVPKSGYKVDSIARVLTWADMGLDPFIKDEHFNGWRITENNNGSYTAECDHFPVHNNLEYKIYLTEGDSNNRTTVKIKSNNPELGTILLDAQDVWYNTSIEEPEITVSLLKGTRINISYGFVPEDAGVKFTGWDEKYLSNTPEIILGDDELSFTGNFKSAIKVTLLNTSTINDNLGAYEKSGACLYPSDLGYDVGETIRFYSFHSLDYESIAGNSREHLWDDRFYIEHTVVLPSTQEYWLNYVDIPRTNDRQRLYLFVDIVAYPVEMSKLVSLDIPSDNNLGTGKDGCIKVTPGTIVNLKVADDSDYTIDYWTTGLSNTKIYPSQINTYFRTINADTLYIAHLKPKILK